MASTYTSRLRLEKQAVGENNNTWGTRLNTVIDLIEDAISGVATVTTTGGNTTLSTENSSSDEARCAIIKVTGTLTSNAVIIIPSASKTYIVWNATAGDFTVGIKTSAGNTLLISQGNRELVLCDGSTTMLMSVGEGDGGDNNFTNLTVENLTVTGGVELPDNVIQYGDLSTFIQNLLGDGTGENPTSVVNNYLGSDGLYHDPVEFGTGVFTASASSDITNDSYYNAWPFCCRLRNGNIVVVYTAGLSHHGDNSGAVVMKTSTDEGATWSAATIVYDHGSLWTSTMGVFQASTGRLFCSVWTDNWNVTGTGNAGIVYSDDNGATWSAFVDLEVPSGFAQEAFAAGHVVELQNGTLAVTVEGTNSGSVANRSVKILFSTDDGVTWGGVVTIRNYSDDTRPYYESHLLQLANGDLLCFHRTSNGSGTIYISKSTDSGATWGVPYSAFSGYSAPTAYQASGGTVFCTVRKNSDASVTMFSSTDNGVTWGNELSVATGMYESEYSCCVELSDERILVIYGSQPTSSTTNSDIKQAYLTETKVRMGPTSYSGFKGIIMKADTSSTADSDPGAGYFKWNHATQASATVLYIDNAAVDGTNISTLHAGFGSSGLIYIQQASDTRRWQIWKWTVTPTNGTGYYKYTCTVQATSSASFPIEDEALCYVVFTSGGGSSSVAEDVWFYPATGMFPSATGGCSSLNRVASGAGKPDMLTLDFDKDTTEEAQFALKAPLGYTNGTITFQGVWSHATATSYGVAIGLSAVAVGDNEAIDTAFGTEIIVTDTGGTTNREYITAASSALTIANTPATGDIIYFKVRRKHDDAGDTLDVDMRLIGIIIDWGF